jgi:hypothetical protein
VLARADIMGGDTGGLPSSLLDAVGAEGGLWYASDAYTDAADIVAKAREVGAVALRLDVRDLSLLEELPGVRYLHLRSDRRPSLDPVASLRGLRALIIETSALVGQLDVVGFPDLRWLRLSVGGKGGAAALHTMARGHPTLEWLAVSETRSKTAAAIAAGFPRLRSLRIHFADILRELGSLGDAAPGLLSLELMLTDIRSLVGIEELADLQALDVFGGPLADLAPLRDLRRLRYARLLVPRVTSIEPLRDHPSLRMLELSMAGEPQPDVLSSMAGLVAVGRGRRFEGPIRQLDLFALAPDHPLRREWRRALSG